MSAFKEFLDRLGTGDEGPLGLNSLLSARMNYRGKAGWLARDKLGQVGTNNCLWNQLDAHYFMDFHVHQVCTTYPAPIVSPGVSPCSAWGLFS